MPDPVVKRYRWSGLWCKYLRCDAVFAIPDLYDYLEANEFGYAIRLRANEVRPQLHALACKLPNSIADGSLTSLQDRMIKIGAKAIRHAHSITLQFAEVASPQNSTRIASNP